MSLATDASLCHVVILAGVMSDDSKHEGERSVRGWSNGQCVAGCEEVIEVVVEEKF